MEAKESEPEREREESSFPEKKWPTKEQTKALNELQPAIFAKSTDNIALDR